MTYLLITILRLKRVTNIRRLIDYPGALQVLQFADGMLSLVAVKAYYGGLLVGYALSALKEHIPNVETRVAAIYRQGKAIKPLGTTVIEADDEVFFIAATKHIRAVMNELQKLERSYKKIMIAGGGNIGAGLARSLEKITVLNYLSAKERAQLSNAITPWCFVAMPLIKSCYRRAYRAG